MNLEKDKLIYWGIGLFALVIIYNSFKKQKEIKNVSSESKPNTLAFDHSSLPAKLKPPKRLNEFQPVPSPLKPRKSMNGISFMPRFEF